VMARFSLFGPLILACLARFGLFKIWRPLWVFLVHLVHFFWTFWLLIWPVVAQLNKSAI